MADLPVMTEWIDEATDPPAVAFGHGKHLRCTRGERAGERFVGIRDRPNHAHRRIDTHSAIRLDITLSAQPELAAVDFQPRNDAAAGIIEPVEFSGAEGCLVELDSPGAIGDGEPR